MHSNFCSYSYPKTVRLRKHGQYKRVGHKHKRHIGTFIIIDVQERNQPLIRLGITVTKKFGHAVLRNRFKRITREAFRLCRHLLPGGMDIVVKPRTHALKASSADIQNELVDFLKLPTS